MKASEIIILIYPYLIEALYLCSLLTALFVYFSRAYMLHTGNRRLDQYLSGAIHTAHFQKKHMAGVCMHVFFSFLISRFLILFIAQTGFILKGQPGGLSDFREFIYTQWDASHYIGIAENGYQTQGDARLHIVFYPLFPMLVRFLNGITANSIVSSAILSNACLILGGVFLYLNTLDSYGEKTARISVWLFMFSMGAIFYSIPYTESLFFLLTTACVYFARKRLFLPALIIGGLCSMTRLPGAITAVCVFFEMIRSRLGYIRRIGEEGSRIKRAAKVTFVSFIRCLLILSGFAVYLAINKSVTGDMFKFLEYQKNHWGQEMGSLFNTSQYSIRYMFHPFVDWYQFGVYVPQCAAILFVAVILFFVKKHAHPADLAYSVVYLFVTLSPSMLISGPRYISAMYCLYPFSAVLMNKNRFWKYLILILWFMFFVYSSYMFMVEWTYL